MVTHLLVLQLGLLLLHQHLVRKLLLQMTLRQLAMLRHQPMVMGKLLGVSQHARLRQELLNLLGLVEAVRED